MGLEVVLSIFFSFIIGVVFGAMGTFLTRRVMLTRQMRIAERKASRILTDAKIESKDMLRDARVEADKAKQVTETEIRERRIELQRQENRFSQKMENVDRKLDSLGHREHNLVDKEKEIESTRTYLTEVKNKQLKQLELISGMSSDEAKTTLLEAIEVE